MDIDTILLTIAGIGILLWGIAFLYMYYKSRNDPIDKINRAFQRNLQIVATVHSRHDNMRFKRYTPQYESDNIKNHPSVLKYLQTIASNDMYTAGEEVRHANALRETRLALSDTIETANAEHNQLQENSVEVKQEPKINIHQPGDRFKDII